MKSKIIRPFIGVIDFLFPSECVNCGCPVPVADNCLCETCLAKISPLENGCEICSGNMTGGKCGICSERKFYLSKNIILYEYSGIIQNIIRSFKFNKKRRLYIHLAGAALSEIKKHNALFDLITAVPMSRKKKWERGFNQAELIAKWLSGKLNKPYLPVLKEKSHFKSQKTLGYRERFINILDRYKILNIEKIKYKNILIIDDIFTTGATINECARIIKSFGAENVYSLTIARADIKRVDLD
ncbi:MAG: ComF family protein [Spirochaetes bacterium]|jgi:ComF family protein|nr:ComF family protein [Spirochaetota bacterium]